MKEEFWSSWLNGFSSFVVFTSSQNIGLFGLTTFPHHHNFLVLFNEFVSRVIQIFQLLAMSQNVYVNICQIVTDSIKITLRLDGICQRARFVAFLNFQRRECSLEDSKFINQTIFESMVPHSFPDCYCIATTSQNSTREIVLNNFSCCLVAIKKNTQSVCQPCSVAADNYMYPPICRYFFDHPNTCSITRPEMN